MSDRGSEDPVPSVSEIIDSERALIGHEIHDQLLPLIFAATANLQSLQDRGEKGSWSETDRNRIDQSLQWLNDALELGRQLLTQVHPPELAIGWLIAAKDACRRVAGRDCEVTWTVNPDSPVCDRQWDPDVAATAYRVLIESVRNATLHGKAESISIRCEAARLSVVDDGSGFSPAEVSPDRFGIRTMKSRGKLVGKRVEIESEPGGPTTVTMHLE